MIKGLRFYSNKDCYYSQSNNAIETYNKTLKNQGLNYWTEPCGPAAAVMILACMGKRQSHTDKFKTWAPQPEDWLFLWFNDPRNAGEWQRYRPDVVPNSIPGNRIPQLYPPAIAVVFGQTCRYQTDLGFDQVAGLVGDGHGLRLCLKKPGHYRRRLALTMSRKN